MNPEKECLKYQNYLKTVAPNLCPIIVPNGYTNDNILKFKVSKKNHMCMIKNCKNSHNNIKLEIWGVEIEKKKFVLKDVGYSCSACYECSQLESFLNLSTEELVKHFINVNGMKENDSQEVQQVYIIAYSLKVLLSRIKSLEIEILYKNEKTKKKKNKKKRKLE